MTTKHHDEQRKESLSFLLELANFFFTSMYPTRAERGAYLKGMEDGMSIAVDALTASEIKTDIQNQWKGNI